ncbi:MAG: geranylgeranyl reductase family protein [Anaerolineae bacterium]
MAGVSRYDVIIAGAGAAGSSAAYFLGEAGARVLVIEKERLPRYKPCGGAVPMAVYQQFPFPFAPVIERQPSHVLYSWRGEQAVQWPLPGRAISLVMRDRFDAHILEHARAEVWDGTTVEQAGESAQGVRVRTAGGDALLADYLIVADGAHSLLAHQLGLRQSRELVGAVEVEYAPAPAAMERFANTAVFEFGALHSGYLWIFPKRDHLSIGIGQLRGRGHALREVLYREMRKFGLDLEDAPWHGHTLPVYQGPEPRSTARALLVGDAAGLVDPLSGEGIRHAVASARIAAQAIIRGKVHAYSHAVERYAQARLRPILVLARLFYEHPWACYRFGVRNQRATELFAGWLNGQLDKARIMTGLLLCFLEGLVHLP